MNDPTLRSSDAISALADGRLGAAESARVVVAVLSDQEAMETWHAYHVVGDVLRSPELVPTGEDFAFLQRLERRLAQEAQHVAPPTATVAVAGADRGESANASIFRWKALAGAACMALVGVVGVNLWSAPGSGGAPQMAALPSPTVSAPVAVVADNAVGTMVRDPQLDALMAAHRQLGGHSALQAPAGFLRNAAYEGARR